MLLKKGIEYTIIIFAVLALQVASAAPSGDKKIINIVSPSGDEDLTFQYFYDMLDLALSKTSDEYGDFELNKMGAQFVQSRGFKHLQYPDDLDVMWTITSKEREKISIAVREPMLKGLYGYRVALIHQDDLEKFDQIESAQGLKNLVAGQGRDWPDFEILRSNGYKTQPFSNYDGIFELVVKRRIDYFPRGVGEILQEIQLHSDKPIMIEPKFMLYYPSFMFFFVSPHEPELAERIGQGIRKAKLDGSFDEVFNRFVNLEEIHRIIKPQSRRIFKLTSPLIPEKSNFDIKPFWHDSNSQN